MLQEIAAFLSAAIAPATSGILSREHTRPRPPRNTTTIAAYYFRKRFSDRTIRHEMLF